MPTPRKFHEIAVWLKPRKVTLWAFALAGLALVILWFALMALKVTAVFNSALLAAGLLSLTYSWGLICIESWFRKRPSEATSVEDQSFFPRLNSLARTFFSWYASIFLVVWFVVGTAMALLSLLTWI